MVCVEKVKLDGWACMAKWAGWSERSYSPKGVGGCSENCKNGRQKKYNVLSFIVT